MLLISGWIERFLDRVGLLLLAAALLVVVGEFAIVALRYGLSWTRPWLQEGVLAANAVLFLLGAAYTLRHDGHVRVDLYSRQRSPRTQALLELIGIIVFLLPFQLFLLWISVPYAWRSWLIGEGSAQHGGLPAVYLVKALIPLAAALLLLAGVGRGLRALDTWLRTEPSTARSAPT
jgi:TRAP-type mannitol/chloroaromatic compound transport system permease small subunit